MSNNESFDKFVDKMLNKDIAKPPKPKQESFDDFIARIIGNNTNTNKNN